MTENTIAIAGGGFAGMRAAMDIANLLKKHKLQNRYSVLLIDRTGEHTFTPLLYKYAVRPEFPLDTVCLNISGLIAGYGIKLILDEVKSADLAKGILHLRSGKDIQAAYIMLSPGSETNWFGIPGLAENALPLKTLEDAARLREKLKSLPQGASVIVGGGGPNGIELAAELKKARGFKVSVIEAASTIMPGFAPRFEKLAARRLAKLGVDILTNESIAEAHKDRVRTKSGKTLSFDLLVWTGGTKVPDWIKNTPMKTEPRGKIESGLDMECVPQAPDLALRARVYGAGDSICVHFPDGSPMPPVARAAIQEAGVAAQNIVRDILSEEGFREGKPREYRPVHYPYVMPIGGNYALAGIGSFIWDGWTALIFKELVVLNYLLSILPLSRALRVWRDGF